MPYERRYQQKDKKNFFIKNIINITLSYHKTRNQQASTESSCCCDAGMPSSLNEAKCTWKANSLVKLSNLMRIIAMYRSTIDDDLVQYFLNY